MANVSLIQSDSRSQVYAIRASDETDGNTLIALLERLSSEMSTVILAQKSGKPTDLSSMTFVLFRMIS